VVATPNPGARFLTRDGVDGLLTSEASLGVTLARLLGDSAHRETLAAAGRRRAADFTWERCAERHEAAYQSAIDRFSAR
jgi:glycosyltransferase involved in cell wall biosynthesis